MSENGAKMSKFDSKNMVAERVQPTFDDVLNMEVRDEDVWICSFPKCGTTWTQEMVWLILHDLDFERAKTSLSARYVFLDICFVMNRDLYWELPEAKKIDDLLHPERNNCAEKGLRFIKTHLPYHLLPKKLRDGSTKAKVVYVSRNPRDACISSFHHFKMMGALKDDLETFCDAYIKDDVYTSTNKAVPSGPYWKHLIGYWKERNSKNLIFIKFEEMKAKLPEVVKKVATFFDKKFDGLELKALCEHLSFEKMKNNSAVNSDHFTNVLAKLNSTEDKVSFIRKGDVNQWKSELSQTLIDRFEKWEKENLKDIKLTYDDL